MRPIDPTKVELSVDPHERRMSGRALHGNVPFDVPFISEIEPDLFMGGCQDGLVLPNDIENVISLYPWEEYTVNHELRSKLEVRMYDSLDGATDQVWAIADWVNVCHDDGPTLVHCQAGLNRSSLITAAALIRSGTEAQDAIDTIREKRSPACLCNPAFEEWLLA